MSEAPAARVLPLLGNEAVARGLVEAGCQLAFAYPGTPSSEVLPALVRFAREEGVALHSAWSANEKVALEAALAAAYCGKRAVVVMKQVGLNVAADPLLSSAYIGVEGGLVIVVADDPGPTSSQTEQDTRQFAHFAKLPVLDPSSPAEARDMAGYAFELSERFATPVILRTSQRVCHGRQDIALRPPMVLDRPAAFQRDPTRWAATPRHRLRLHHALNARLERIAAELEACPFNRELHPEAQGPLGIIAAGPPLALLLDLLVTHGLAGQVPILALGAAHPLPKRLVEGFLARHERVLVLEEPDQLIELLLDERARVHGRHDGTVPNAGVLDAAALTRVLGPLLAALGIIAQPWPTDEGVRALVAALDLPARPPTLCPGCPHRTSFFAIQRVGGRQGLYPSDIGCYTLGASQGAVDTVHDMGASVSMATGFYHAHAHGSGAVPPIFATIGDSTFYHGGLPALADAVTSGARFVLVVLDNRTTAMTGMQPTLMSGVQPDGSQGPSLDLEATCRGLGVRWLQVVNPYEVHATIKVMRAALAFTRAPEGGVAVVVTRQPCVIHQPGQYVEIPVAITDRCNLCGVCLDQFGCPALARGVTKVEVDPLQCIRCGTCIPVCARGAIVPAEEG
ncbi:MAG: thiamine pyrophosphate-dependent enzyme [Pseudomonadota bacterium]